MMKSEGGLRPRPYFGPGGMTQGDWTGSGPIGPVNTNDPGPKPVREARRTRMRPRVGSGADFTFESLLRSYIGGQKTFRFPTDGNPRTTASIQAMAASLYGLRVIGVDSGHIIVKDGLGEAEMCPRAAVRRLHLVTRAILQEAASSAGKANADRAIESWLAEVERLGWLINRQYNLLEIDGALARRLGIQPSKALSYLLVSANLRNIAEAAAGLEGDGKGLLTEEEARRMHWTGDVLCRLLDSVFFGAFLAQDREQAARIIEAVDNPRFGFQGGGPVAIAVGRIGLAVRDIASIVQELHAK